MTDHREPDTSPETLRAFRSAGNLGNLRYEAGLEIRVLAPGRLQPADAVRSVGGVAVTDHRSTAEAIHRWESEGGSLAQ